MGCITVCEGLAIYSTQGNDIEKTSDTFGNRNCRRFIRRLLFTGGFCVLPVRPDYSCLCGRTFAVQEKTCGADCRMHSMRTVDRVFRLVSKCCGKLYAGRSV